MYNFQVHVDSEEYKRLFESALHAATKALNADTALVIEYVEHHKIKELETRLSKYECLLTGAKK